MKNKQRKRHGVTPNSKLPYLPLSPPSHQKSPQDSHYQSSSSPVGRPPPYLLNNDATDGEDMIHASDIDVLKEFDAFLKATQEGEPSSSSSSDNDHCFNTLNECPMDFDLCDILGGNPGEMDDDSMSFSDNNDLFPALPDNNGEA